MGKTIGFIVAVIFIPLWFGFMIYMAEQGYKVDGRWLLPLALEFIIICFPWARMRRK